MNKLFWIGAFAVLTCAGYAQAEEEEQVEFSVLARRYRIAVYDAFHEDRPTYDRLQQLGRMAEWMHAHTDDAARHEELTAWVHEATALAASGDVDVELPALPGQSQYDTLEEFAAAIEFDDKAAKWLQHQADPAVAQFSPRRRPSARVPSDTQLSSTTPSNSSQTTVPSYSASQTESSDDEKPSVLSRVLSVVTGGSDDEDSSANETPAASGQPQEDDETVDADALSLEAFDTEDELDSNQSAPATDNQPNSGDADLGTTPTSSAADSDSELAEHREILSMLQRLLKNDVEQIDRKMLNLQTVLMENWFGKNAELQSERTSAEQRSTLKALHADAVTAVEQLRDRATQLLVEAQGVKEPSAAQRSEIKQLRSLQKRLEKLLASER